LDSPDSGLEACENPFLYRLKSVCIIPLQSTDLGNAGGNQWKSAYVFDRLEVLSIGTLSARPVSIEKNGSKRMAEKSLKLFNLIGLVFLWGPILGTKQQTARLAIMAAHPERIWQSRVKPLKQER